MSDMPPVNEIVTRGKSIEWGTLWGYLPDPDPILLKTGQSTKVFEDLLSDAHVFACYQSRKAGVLTSEWKLEYPKGTEKQAKFYDNLLRDLPIEQIISQMLDAPFYGFSAMEVVWKSVDGKWTPVRIEQKPNEWFVFDPKNQLRFLSRNNQFPGQLLPRFKFLVPRNFPTYQNPYGIRILSRCFWPVVFKRGGYKYWAQFMEKFGIPWLIGKVPRGTTIEDRTEMLGKLTEMVQSAAAVINDDEAVEGLELGRKGQAGRENIFEGMINSANGEISKAILTQTLTTEIGDQGAYAASQSHLTVRDDLCWLDKKIIIEEFNKLFRWCNQFNFGMDSWPYIRFIEEEKDLEPQARRDTQLVTQGVRFKESYYERMYNLRSDEFSLTDPSVGGSSWGNDPSKQNAKEERKNEKRKDDRAKGTKDKARKESK